MKLTTKRFLLRDFTDPDRASFVAYQVDPRYGALHGPERSNSAEADRLLDTFARWAAEAPRVSFQFAVARRADGTLVGCAGLRRGRAGDDVAELGIELAPDYWGRYRYAVEIADALLDFGFGPLGLDAIRGVTTDATRRAARLAAWFGATLVATRPGPDWATARGWSETEWEITRSRWRRSALGSRATRVGMFDEGEDGST